MGPAWRRRAWGHGGREGLRAFVPAGSGPVWGGGAAARRPGPAPPHPASGSGLLARAALCPGDEGLPQPPLPDKRIVRASAGPQATRLSPRRDPLLSPLQYAHLPRHRDLTRRSGPHLRHPTWPRRGRPQQQQRPLEAPGPAHGAAATAAAARSRPGTCTSRAAGPAPESGPAPGPAHCAPGWAWRRLRGGPGTGAERPGQCGEREDWSADGARTGEGGAQDRGRTGERGLGVSVTASWEPVGADLGEWKVGRVV